jgi:hypothetical protein
LRTPPSASGREVVGAATMPPVGAYVSAFSVTSERRTTSSQRPVWAHRAAHSLQKASVSRRAISASTGSGATSLDGNQARTKGTRSPSSTVKVAYVLESLSSSATGVRSETPSGPAIPRSPPSSSRIHGAMDP